MENTSFMRVEEVAQELGVSKSYAYKIVQRLNAELKEKGVFTISGRVNRKYFMERTCYPAFRVEGFPFSAEGSWQSADRQSDCTGKRDGEAAKANPTHKAQKYKF